MSEKFTKAHWTIYTILIKDIEVFLVLLITNSEIIKLLIEKEVPGNKNVLRIIQTRYQFHFEAYI